MLRIGTIDDLDLVVKHSLSFAKTIKQTSIVEDDKIKEIARAFLVGPTEEKVILLHGDEGMLVAFIQPFVLGSAPVANELAWWVDPEHRKSRIGKELVEAYEFWAKKMNCKYAIMSCYADNDLGAFYEKQGYILHEKAYLKEL